MPPAEERALGHEARRVGRRVLEQGGGARRHALAEEEEERVQGLGAAREAVVGAHEPEHDERERAWERAWEQRGRERGVESDEGNRSGASWRGATHRVGTRAGQERGGKGEASHFSLKPRSR